MLNIFAFKYNILQDSAGTLSLFASKINDFLFKAKRTPNTIKPHEKQNCNWICCTYYSQSSTHFTEIHFLRCTKCLFIIRNFI